MEQTITVSGAAELAKDFEKVIKKYPDDADNFLKRQARELRKNVVKNVKKDTHTKGATEKSLAKLKNYKISRIWGYGADRHIEISAQSPHFHLVERGHNLVIKGKTVKFVAGKHMMDNAVKSYEEQVEQAAEQFIDKLLKEGGF